MRKKDELTRPDTCMAHAHPNEMVFVLLSRDPAAPAAIRAWASERIRLGKNEAADPQIVEALQCANTMQAEGRKWADFPRTEDAPGSAKERISKIREIASNLGHPSEGLCDPHQVSKALLLIASLFETNGVLDAPPHPYVLKDGHLVPR